MKHNFLISIKLSLVMLALCAGIYPLVIAGISKAAPGKGDGKTVAVNGKVVGYELIGQKFSDDKYFWGRPSAVDYNAAGSGGSNKGPSNPAYLQQVSDRIDTFLAHNPGVTRKEIPSDLVTASGSGLDPDISPAAAYIQVKRIASVRHLDENVVRKLVDQHVDQPFLGMLGPSTVNVLKLNVALDQLK